MKARLEKYLTDVVTLPGDAAAGWRSAGVGGVWTELRRRTIDRLGGHGRYLVIDVDLHRVKHIPAPDGVVIRRFTGTDWSSLGGLVSQRGAPVCTSALNAGRVCLVAWHGAEPLGLIWVSPWLDQWHEQFVLPLPSDAVYLWHIKVVPAARRHGVGAALGSAGLEFAAQQGFRRGWMVTSPTNLAAQKTVGSVGACRVLGTIRRVKLGSWMPTRYTPYDAPIPLEGYIQS